MSRRIDNQKTGDLVLSLAVLVQNSSLRLDRIDGEVRCTDLLSDTTRFALLDIRLSNLNLGQLFEIKLS